MHRFSSAVGCTAGLALLTLGAAPAGAFYVIGPTQVPDPTLTQDINVPSPTLTFNQGAPLGVLNTSPIAGVITSWRTYSGQLAVGSGLQLRVLTDAGGGAFTVVRSGPVEPTFAPLNGKATPQTFKARIPIPAGASIGVQRTRTSGANVVTIVYDHPNYSAFKLGWFFADAPAAPADGQSGTPLTQDGSGDPGSDPFFPMNAIVEADADGDEFGDETQDRCPGTAGANAGCPGDAFAVPAAPGRGATVLGPNLTTVDPSIVVDNPRPQSSVVMNTTTSAGAQGAARSRGVITRWSFYTGAVYGAASAQLRIMRRADDAGYVAATSGPVEPLQTGTDPATLRTFAARVPVFTGDQLAVRLEREEGGLLEVAALKTDSLPSAWAWGQLAGAFGTSRVVNDGEVGYFTGQSFGGATANTFLPLSAVVENDSDGDLFGDHTQDRCLDQAGPVDGCPAPPAAPAETPQTPQAPPTVVVNTVLPASANVLVGAATVKLDARRRTLTVGLSCPAQTTPACDGRVSARTSAKFRVGKRKAATLSLGSASFKLAQGATKTLKLKVPATTRAAIAKTKRVRIVVTVDAPRRTTTTVR
jgi:hypothetical protein